MAFIVDLLSLDHLLPSSPDDTARPNVSRLGLTIEGGISSEV
jgi:hypothetical protein